MGLILANLTQIQAANFFFKNLALSVTRCHGQLSTCTISEKTKDPIFRKLSDGKTDEQTDPQRGRRTRVIPSDAVQLTLSVQKQIVNTSKKKAMKKQWMIIISNGYFDKNIFTQNTMEIRVEYESLYQKCENTANYGDPPTFIFHPLLQF